MALGRSPRDSSPRCFAGRGGGQTLQMASPQIARDFGYVNDIVDALSGFDRLHGLRGEVINLASGVQTTLREVVEAVLTIVPSASRVEWSAMPDRKWDTECWVADPSLASHVGHIGSALSVVEILVVLFEAILKRPGTLENERDRFILCKGHASLALYSVLRMRGIISPEAFATYCGEGSLLGVHPEHFLPGVDVSTGSLGQGLSIGCGLALGLRRKGLDAKVHALVSDAELNEGQVWEPLMFAAYHVLDNLVITVDKNGLQAMGATRDVVELEDLVGRFEQFGLDATEVDGHDVEALEAAYRRRTTRPSVVVANTVLGKGVSFMEGRLLWHYHNLDEDLAGKALAEIGAAG